MIRALVTCRSRPMAFDPRKDRPRVLLATWAAGVAVRRYQIKLSLTAQEYTELEAATEGLPGRLAERVRHLILSAIRAKSRDGKVPIDSKGLAQSSTLSTLSTNKLQPLPASVPPISDLPSGISLSQKADPEIKPPPARARGQQGLGLGYSLEGLGEAVALVSGSFLREHITTTQLEELARSYVESYPEHLAHLPAVLSRLRLRWFDLTSAQKTALKTPNRRRKQGVTQWARERFGWDLQKELGGRGTQAQGRQAARLRVIRGQELARHRLNWRDAGHGELGDGKPFVDYLAERGMRE